MTRLWFPLLIAAALLCCLIAYAREQARQDAEWAETCAKVEAAVPKKGGQ